MKKKIKICSKKNKATKEKFTYAIAEDHKMFRTALIDAIADFGSFELVYQAGTGSELITKFDNTVPDLVLLDIEMPVMDGITALNIIKKQYPFVKVIMLTMHDDNALIEKVLEIGGNAYLLKEYSIEILIEAMEGVLENNFYFRDGFNKKLLTKIVRKNLINPCFKEVEFSRREIEIAQLMYYDLSTLAIADTLYISKKTVDRHSENMRLKIGARSSIGIVVYAIKHNLIKVDYDFKLN